MSIQLPVILKTTKRILETNITNRDLLIDEITNPKQNGCRQIVLCLPPLCIYVNRLYLIPTCSSELVFYIESISSV